MTDRAKANDLLREAMVRYFNDPMLHQQVYTTIKVLELVTPTVTDNEGRRVSMTSATRDDWLTAAAIALVVAERDRAAAERGD